MFIDQVKHALDSFDKKFPGITGIFYLIMLQVIENARTMLQA